MACLFPIHFCELYCTLSSVNYISITIKLELLELFKKETEMPLRVDEYFLHENYEDYKQSIDELLKKIFHPKAMEYCPI